MGSVARLDLYWIPLGAGASVVRRSGRLYERVAARAARRSPADLFHSALVATRHDRTVMVEMAPVPDRFGPERRGVVAEGAVGSRLLRPLRVFRYEIRRWPDGHIPDLPFAIGGPVPLTDDANTVEAALSVVALVPTPVWGRDELRAGEMWNSNSVVSWTLSRSGLLGAAGAPPGDGRAPGWDAGVTVARRAGEG